MAKLRKFEVEIETGKSGNTETVHFCINNHKLAFETSSGGAGPGETFKGAFEVNSYAHSLTLAGPESGEWDINKIKVNFDLEGGKPYEVAYGEVTLNETNEVNLWRDPPIPAFDV